jgi:hypothetical protein
MRLVVHKWIDENSVTSKRYIVVVKPKRPRPLFYDRVLNNVVFGGELRSLNWRLDDPLSYFKIASWMINEKIDLPIWTRLDQFLNLAGYGESLEFCGDPTYYFQMFTALIREKCDRDHPLAKNMNIYDFSFAKERAEETLNNSPFNIVFTVINQGDRIETKHDILEINFSLITNNPEPLIIDQ